MGGRVLLFLLAFSLFPLPAIAGPYADLDARLRGRPDKEAVAALQNAAGKDQEAHEAAQGGAKSARAYIAVRASLEGAPPSTVPPIAASATDDRIASSWLARALSRLQRPNRRETPDLPSGAGMGSWFTTLMWCLLAGLGMLAVFLLARYVRLPGSRRKVALVDDEEPMRTADAWLEEANALIAQGRYREAVRGLYVAGLLRFDEAGVARFDRHQTNWEHLRRIEASPKRPDGTEVRDATGRFDRVWYGHLGATLEDAHLMRSWYDGLVRRLAEVKPA